MLYLGDWFKDLFIDEAKNALSKECCQNPSQNTGNGMSATTSELLIAILRNGVYNTDQSANITALEVALASSDHEEDIESDIKQDGAVLTMSGISAITSITQSGNILTMT